MTDFMTVGDLARQLVARRQNADLRDQMNTLVSEVGSGKRADLATSLRGDFSLISGLESDLARLEAHSRTISDLSGQAAAMQRVLSTGRDLATETASRLITASPPTTSDTVAIVAAEARGRFSDLAARLNTGFAGATLFAGISTDSPAVADGDAMLADLEAIVAPLTDADDVEAAIRAWFAPSGGYETIGYLGNATPKPGLEISPTRRLAIDTTANDPALRESLTGLAMAALADRPPLAGAVDQQGALMVAAAEQLQGAQSGLADLQGRLGTVEAELVRESTRNAAERTALEESRATITDVDIFESATALEAVQSRLELLYTITARSAQLSLVRVLG